MAQRAKDRKGVKRTRTPFLQCPSDRWIGIVVCKKLCSMRWTERDSHARGIAPQGTRNQHRKHY